MSSLVNEIAAAPFPQTVLAGSLVDRFEAIVTRYPDHIALQCEDEGYSYRAINQQANVIAAAIARKQPARHRPIVVATGDPFLTIAAIWGVLKSGHAYVTVDPNNTQSAVAIIADSNAELIVVANRDALSHLALDNPSLASDFTLIAIDEIENCLADEQTDVSILPTDMAVILYTSGSTGQPKGIVCNHELLLHRVWHDTAQFQLTPDARLMLTTAPNLGVSSGILYGAMLNGASCHLYSMKERGVTGLPQWLRDNGITHYHTTPTIFRQLIEAFDGLIDLPHLRWIKLGGEATQRADVELFQRHVLPPCRLRAGYSITEALLVSEFYLTQETTWDGEKVPMGYPVTGKEILLLDESCQPVAPGAVGEIAVRSRYLAQGYWQQPEQTAARFLSDPEQPDVRILLTGDLGCLRPDGMLEHWGRKDQMVKIRGYRVELSAVEGALLNLPMVHTAVVTTHDGQNEEKQLVAYVVPTDAPPTISEIRTALQQTLADYMIPSYFVMLDELPLLSNGKVDRKALPVPDTRRPHLETLYVAARNPLEVQLVKLWEDLLGIHPIGIHDNFFELGGHSLLATQLMAQVQTHCQMALSLPTLFVHATVAALAKHLDAIASSNQVSGAIHASADLLLNNAKNGSSKWAGDVPSELPTIVPAPAARHLPFPLNDIQQAYWVGRNEQFVLGNVATHNYREVENMGLDVERFKVTLNLLIKRHDMLRAIILPDATQQILAEVPPYQVNVVDLSDQDRQTIERKLAAIRTDLSAQSLRTDQWPLFDVRLTCIEAPRDGHDARWRIHLSFDALIFDGWSTRLLFREWQQLYADPSAVLPKLSFSFRDYVLAENALKATARYQKAATYWQQRLATLPAAPQLPLAKKPEALRQPHFVRRTATIDAQDWQRLKQQAGRAGLTPSALLLTIYAEVLAVWSKDPHFTINLTLFNRLPMHEQVNAIIGDFTSLTLLEVNGAAAAGFLERARQLQQQLAADLEHRYFSGIAVLRELARRGTPIPMPVVFTSHLAHTIHQEDGLDFLGEIVHRSSQTPQVWLDCVVLDHGDTLSVTWNAVEALFPAGLLNEMFAGFCRLITQLSAEDDLWQATPAEMTRRLVPQGQLALVQQANDTRASFPDEWLHTPFAAQVAQRPDQLAVIAGQKQLTYRQLYCAANQVGHLLRVQGACPNQLVAIVMEKGWEQVVAALGILHAGAAYLPIDAATPQERLWHLLAHGAVQLVLTQSWIDDTLAWPETVQRIIIDGPELLAADDSPLDPIQTPQDLAYVIYTSGSTGLPKGVMIDHCGARNTIADLNQRFQIGPNDRLLALSALTFDLSVYDIFGTLAAGGTIVIPPAAATHDPAAWAALAKQEQITIWNSVPALISLLVDYCQGRPHLFPESLRLIWMSGDWIPVSLPTQIREVHPHVQLVSMGGATEASIWSVLYPIDAVDPQWPSIPYGKAMMNQTIQVLNHALEPCPFWVPGQLYIGGVGLAKGYWRDAEKTDAAFFIHPRTGERLYRTGDLGRYLPDGNIEFLGREDSQVKVQGFRVELGEIETALMQHPSVSTAVVTSVGAREQQKRLVAYLLCTDPAPHPSELSAFLRQKLPAYMVPAAFITLDRLPLTANGKLERTALPIPEEKSTLATTGVAISGAATTETRSPAFDSAHRQMQQVTEQILEIAPIAMDENLLGLGITSIEMIRIINAVEKAFDFRPNIGEFYERPQIATLVHAYERHLGQQTAHSDLAQPSQRIVEIRDPVEREAFKEQRHNLRPASPENVQIDLPAAASDDEWQMICARRRTERQFALKPIALEQFSSWLSCLRQSSCNGQPKYHYASAGGLYPVQTYLYVKPGRVDQLPAGVYYYQPHSHRLAVLSQQTLDPTIYDPLINRPIFAEAAFALFLIAQQKAIAPLYGERSMHYATLEAGAMTHLLEMAAPRYELGLCQVGHVDFATVQHLFALDEGHLFVHSLLGGGIEQHHAQRLDELRTQTSDPTMRLLQQIQQLSPAETQSLLQANRNLAKELDTSEGGQDDKRG